MNLFSFVKRFFMYFSCKNKLPKTIIVIFPGFGFSPKDYDDILPKKTAKIQENLGGQALHILKYALYKNARSGNTTPVFGSRVEFCEASED